MFGLKSFQQILFQNMDTDAVIYENTRIHISENIYTYSHGILKKDPIQTNKNGTILYMTLSFKMVPNS